jgi:MurNAc alpha-1-phosphate uridylyltransferase
MIPTLMAPPAPIPAMVLAAGRGERMRPLTDHCPKPLLTVRGKPLLQWLLDALARDGVQRVVLNTAWLDAQLMDYFLNPSAPMSLSVAYSHEGRDFGAALETAGGIARALPLLCPAENKDANRGVFWVLAADVFVPDFVFSKAAVDRFVASDKLAHLWLVANPAHNPKGDFGLSAPDSDGVALALNLALDDPRLRYTYATIGLYREALFAPPHTPIPAGNLQGIKAPLAPLLRAAMDNGEVSAELYDGAWTDVGTPHRLAQLNP